MALVVDWHMYMLPSVLLAKPAVKTLQEHLVLLERANAAGVLVRHAVVVGPFRACRTYVM